MTRVGKAQILSAKLALGAVRRPDAEIRSRFLEATFAGVFSGLVYPQIWEDPLVDLEALALAPGHRVIAIASGGCNVMSYLTAAPVRITAVDLNAHHIALLRLKLAAARYLPDHAAFAALFRDADRPGNVALFDRWIAPHLDEPTRAYWRARDLFGRRRIDRFSRGFYRFGALGRFTGFAHFLARLHGCRPERLLQARTRAEQREIFTSDIAPVLAAPLVRAIVSSRGSLFGLGIPPAQYDALAGGRPMVDTLLERLERLACGFDIADNYFAAQAFGRRYGLGPDASLPPYLEEVHFERLREAEDRVDPVQRPLTDVLAESPAGSFDRYVLLDAQDWMSPGDLTRLWTQISRTAASGARVLFRTAAGPSLLPGRVDPAILARWTYQSPLSADLTGRDRSAIYGGVHVYWRGEAA